MKLAYPFITISSAVSNSFYSNVISCKKIDSFSIRAGKVSENPSTVTSIPLNIIQILLKHFLDLDRISII